MSLLYRTILRPAVFLQDSEKAHNRIIFTLAKTPIPCMFDFFNTYLFGLFLKNSIYLYVNKIYNKITINKYLIILITNTK